MKKIAFITGIKGQDGKYLSKFLFSKKYKVYGISSNFFLEFKNERFHRVKKIKIDKNKLKLLSAILTEILPSEIYHLASKHERYEKINYDDKNIFLNYQLTRFFLDFILQKNKKCKFYFSSSSKIYDGNKIININETSKAIPVSNYAKSKYTSMQIIKYYRQKYKIYACYGILFNHNSPLRKKSFLLSYIAENIVQINFDKRKKIFINNINAKIDISHAKDVAESMWKMLQISKPQDLIIGSGNLISVSKILDISFGYFNLNWQKYTLSNSSKTISFFPKKAVISKAKKEINWKTKINLKQIIYEMIEVKLKKIESNYK